MNRQVMYVRVRGELVPIAEATLVQVHPDNRSQIVSEIPLSFPLESLVEKNLTAFVQIAKDRAGWLDKVD